MSTLVSSLGLFGIFLGGIIVIFLRDILALLKAINAKLLNMEMTVRKSPEGAYIRIGDKRAFDPDAFINTKRDGS